MEIKLPLIKGSDGAPSGTFTFTVIAFAIVSVCVIMSMFKTITVGSTIVEINTQNTELLLGFLFGPLGAYAYRRTTSEKMAAETPTEPTPASPAAEKQQLNG